MKRNLLLTPGPTQIPPDICAYLGKSIIHHRTPQFQDEIKQAIEGLHYVFQTKNEICMFPASGTGAMEACVANLLSPGDKAICLEAGKFGERWTELCHAYKAVPSVLRAEWGRDVKPSQVEDLLKKNPDVKAVFMTLCETSTGVTSDVKAIAHVVKNTKAVLVVDAVSGLGVVDCQTDHWGVDLVASASHKGLMLPPGLAFVSVSKKAWPLIEEAKSPRYYYDLRRYKKALEKVDTPFTPAIGIMVAMNESIRQIRADGLQQRFAHYERLAKGTRAAAKALGLTLLADASCISNALTAITVPASVDGEKLVKIMRDTYGITAAGGQEELKGKLVRIAHMGCLDEYDMLTGIACLEKVLHQLGYKFELGAGLSAAQKVFNP